MNWRRCARRSDCAAAPTAGPDWSGWSERPGGLVERECGEDALIDTLRRLPSDVRDIDIVRPSLDDLYASFQQEAS